MKITQVRRKAKKENILKNTFRIKKEIAVEFYFEEVFLFA